MGQVPADYLDWLRDQDWVEARWPQVWAYIEGNEDTIDDELNDELREEDIPW